MTRRTEHTFEQPEQADPDQQPTGRGTDHAHEEPIPFELMEAVCTVLRRYADELEEARENQDDIYEADYAKLLVPLVRESERQRIAEAIEGLVLDSDEELSPGCTLHCIEEYNAGLRNGALRAREDQL